AGVLLPIAFWIYLVVAVVTGIAAGSVGLLLVALVVSLMAGVLYQGVVVSLVRDVQDGKRDRGMGDLISEAMPFVGPLLGAGILSAIAIGFGFVLLVVPGLILLTIWAVLAPVIVIERSGVMGAFGRSRELVRGNGWPVFGAIIVAFLIAFVVGAILSSIALAITDGVILQIVFSALASTVTAPITALVAAVLYYRLLAVQDPPPAAPGGTSFEDLPPPAAPPADPPAPAPPTPGT
ncbi:MAG TPA: hypothetical protein VG458_06140, partial [Solirubrobacterales bacterium]|nr:hypothetical protein [Solirubrobacterales bacterium]